MSKIIVILGKRGMGKTTYAKKYILDNEKQYDNIYIYDNFNQFDFIDHKKINPENFPIEDYSLYVFDEIDLIFSQYDSQKTNINLYYLFNESRIYHIDILCTARRFHRVNKDIIALATDLIIFKLTEPRDIKVLQYYCNINENIVKNLNKFEYVHVEI